MISPSSIEKVTETARIEEVVGDFVALKKRGTNLLGLCPFHNEKTPSFNVSPVRGIFKCFGCGKAGNSVGFIMEHEKLSYPEAIRYLAKKYQIEIEEQGVSEEAKQEGMEREALFLVNQWAADYFENQMWNTETGKAIALTYFSERKFSEATIRKFRLGFHPEGWSEFTEAAVSQGYNKDYLVKTGLTINKEGKLFDRFRGRVMFPIFNISGKIIGFGGRILTSDKKQAKYINSPESDIYHKSHVLYGINLARKAIIEQDECLLVEGYTDVISLHQAGIENVVASSGTSLTHDQIKIILRYTKNITVLYDGDQAGLKASFRGIDMILEQGMNVKLVMLPEGEDPDSFSRANSPLFIRDYIQNEATDFITFKTKILLAEAKGNPIRIAEIIREIISSLALIPDPIIRSLFVKDCSERLEIPEQTLINELNKQIRNLRNRKETSPSAPFAEESPDNSSEGTGDNHTAPTDEIVADIIPAEAQETDIIRILIKYANREFQFPSHDEKGEKIEIAVRTGDFILNELVGDDLEPENETYQRIYQIFLEAGEKAYPEENWFLQHPDSEISLTAINLTSHPHILSDQWSEKHGIYVVTEEDLLRKMVIEAVYTFKLRKVQAMLSNIRKDLSTAPEEEIIPMLERYKMLENAKVELAGQLSYVIL